MMIEVEMKIPVNELSRYEHILQEIGAEFLGEEHHIDLYFQHPCRDFRVTDEALRVRICGDKIFLTYKGSKKDFKLKVRPEIEVEVSNAEKIMEILLLLGFKCVAKIRKRRRVYKAFNLKIALDSVSGLGNFIEIEAIVDEEYSNAIDKVKTIARYLNLPLDKSIIESYLELYLKKHGTPSSKSLT